MLALVSFESPSWIVPALVLFIAACWLSLWCYRSTDIRVRLKRIALSLKCFALTLLAVCLIEPVWSGVQAKPHSNHFIVLADNSQSLRVNHALQDKATLADRFSKLLDAQQPQHWLERLGQDFSLHQAAFDRRLRTVSSFKELAFDGEQSVLKLGWTSLKQRFQGQPVGGVLLLSDGFATDVTLAELEQQAASWKQLAPCYPVVFASESTRPDLTLSSVSVSETSFEDAPITVTCEVQAIGLNGRKDLSIACQLIGADRNVLEDQTLPLTEGKDQTVFRFQVKPTSAGLSFYAIEAVLVGTSDKVTVPEEATLANNRRLVQINRGAEKHRILYVSGRPNWEFKFLRRAVEDDAQVDLVGMIRIAKREAKFDFRGRDGQSSNALFRGFKKDTDEETERFDEAVIVRLNTKTPDELRGGFPKEAKDLYGFEAVVLDDIEAGFFTHDQLTLLGKFVSERGGGLLMLGGSDSFGNGQYERTPVADALPVYLDRAKAPPEDSALRLNLTREGWLQTWTRLRATEAEEQTRLQDVASFKALNSVRGIKPGAAVLATVTDGSGTHWPALVTQQFGRGHVGSMLVGDLWRSQIKATEASRGDLAKAWRQTIRWLISDVPQRLQVTTEPAPEFASDAVRVRIKAVDDEYRPMDNARVKVTCSGPLLVSAADDASSGGDRKSTTSKDDSDAVTKTPITLTAEAVSDAPGVYETIFVPRAVGGWNLSVAATDGDGEDLPSTEVGWVHDPLTSEFQGIGTRREFLEKLASITGGRVVEAERLDEFVSGLKNQPMPVTEAWTMPLWDHPLVFGCVLACLLGEWALRRLSGIA